ncbi:ribokinase [Cylindrospermopsis curvispora]|uniref:Ribokinase n=1 Tax=Cylindrospermopsis curvispora GIHE-G1 TaxID=2666332 RepID=A0A7H0EWM4_9CYAN|nr:ribokinase [Cylindrospermopsis curvispora]QNP28190.1 ribokinase [Cylindrospermopsis curvispora GIHE-G1]BAZ89016.1 ribokinase [Raphidiopsis curvata NIES-932]
MTIIVFGSINMDLVATTPRLPIPGETLLGESFFTAPGGKGANQAVALAKLGIPTQMIGRVGNDNFGRQLIKNLESYGIKTENIIIDDTVSSGVAIITVDRRGENNIIVIPGANGQVNQDNIDRLYGLLPSANAILLQLEIPLDMVITVAQIAHQAKVQVILDPAPVPPINLPEEIYPLVDIITPNEIEASQLVGFAVNEEQTAFKAGEILLTKGARCVVIKLGAKGVYCATKEERFFIPPFSVNAIDTVAAGDAFNGGLAAGLFHHKTLREAVIWGGAAGALATTQMGAQSSFPDMMTLKTFLDKMTRE